MCTNTKNQLGFGIIETIVAMALFIVFAATGIVTVVGSFTTNRLGDEETEASFYAQAGIEAVRSIKNQGWSAPFTATTCETGCGLSNASGSWAWSGSNNVSNGFTRTITVSAVQRNGEGVIVPSGGTNDADTKKITSTVTWNFTPLRNNIVSFTTYLTNFAKSIITLGNWAIPAVQSSINAAGNVDGVRIVVEGNYAYLIRTSGSPNFLVYDITNLAAPVQVGSLTHTSNLTNIFVSGTRAYVTGTATAAELMIVDITNPAAPALLGTYNAPSTEDGNDIFVSGNTGYFVRTNGASAEFTVLNVTNPAAVTILGSLNLNSTIREVAVVGSYAYVASSDNNRELQVINIADSASPTLTGVYNAADTDDAVSVAAFESTVLLGKASGGLYIVSTTTPSAPTLLGTFAAGGQINDISLGNNNTYAFLGTSNTAREFAVVNIASPTSPVLLSGLNLTGNSFGVYYSSIFDRAFIANGSDTTEFIIVKPN